jgi:hypothetical protein
LDEPDRVVNKSDDKILKVFMHAPASVPMFPKDHPNIIDCEFLSQVQEQLDETTVLLQQNVYVDLLL